MASIGGVAVLLFSPFITITARKRLRLQELPKMRRRDGWPAVGGTV
ncbi:MAG: hypothetical protein ABFS19_10175 [Thermodesulfobacteriota bacterium]